MSRFSGARSSGVRPDAASRASPRQPARSSSVFPAWVRAMTTWRSLSGFRVLCNSPAVSRRFRSGVSVLGSRASFWAIAPTVCPSSRQRTLRTRYWG